MNPTEPHEKNIKEAQGRKSRKAGSLNRARILSLLRAQPLTFKELHKEIGLSQPVLSKHLKKLKDEELIEKTFDEAKNKVVYRIVSVKEAQDAVKASLMEMLTYILPKPESELLSRFIENLAQTVLEYQKSFPRTAMTKAFEDKVFKRLDHALLEMRIRGPKMIFKGIQPPSIEDILHVYDIDPERFEEFRAKHPKIAKELLRES